MGAAADVVTPLRGFSVLLPCPWVPRSARHPRLLLCWRCAPQRDIPMQCRLPQRQSLRSSTILLVLVPFWRLVTPQQFDVLVNS